MSATGKATGAALALCEAMGWEPDLGHSEGWIPKGGQLAVEVLAELREAGWTLVPTQEPGE